jgi:Glycosyltransferase family 87
VLPPNSTRKLHIAPRIKRYSLVLFVYVVVVFLAGHFSEALQGTDFPDFYAAARMVAAGHGHQLYDADLQRQYQARYSGRVGTLYIHPPFEAVIYLAVAWLPLRRAYLLWSLLSLTFLAIATRRLAKEIPLPWDWEVQFTFSLIFVPLLLCLQQGQDSLLLFLTITLAFVALRRERPFAAGCWLGLALFKFQIALPVFLVLLLSQSKSARYGLAKGFSVIALALAGISAAICGTSVFTEYPGFLLHLKNQPFAGVMPQIMANFRGLIYLVAPSKQSGWAVCAVAILSSATLIKTLMVWKQQRITIGLRSSSATANEVNQALAATVLFALLVSFHLNPHDLSLLLLPIPLYLSQLLAPKSLRDPRNIFTLILLGFLLLPPFHLWALRGGIYAVLALPMFVLCMFGFRTGVTTLATTPGKATAIRG